MLSWRRQRARPQPRRSPLFPASALLPSLLLPHLTTALIEDHSKFSAHCRACAQRNKSVVKRLQPLACAHFHQMERDIQVLREMHCRNGLVASEGPTYPVRGVSLPLSETLKILTLELRSQAIR
jgi:hypothetical protein